MILPTVQLLWMTLIAGLLLLLLTPLVRLLIVAALTTLIEIAFIILVALKAGTRTATSIIRTMKITTACAADRPMIAIKHVRILKSSHDCVILPHVSSWLLSSVVLRAGFI